MSNQSDWVQICEDVQARLLETTPLTVESANILRTKIFQCLTTASNEGILKTKLNEIYKLLKITKPTKGIIEITGGQRNFNRIKEIPHFERCDGCWFDFAILVDENIKPAEIIAFDFEIRFLENNPTKFLRFDLNLPEHNNDDKGKRFHIHPGNDDLMIHASPMSPLEILHLFLYDLKIPERPRS
ncbi:hypothetical protein IQ227_02545 [Anabaena aphanizomenioides LEGE 00250]|uniref:Uncharacterized protein n=1 Tax=Sphaerospermopsis aphanizomenoides LEGE 00250 TaxID=2777972 RepID=A0ABR9VB67_9CYAN|nr:hypothetical protein [Sphaerospermopsis aphanizomenoides]MBE9234947.1 hypothetical protein [Sphaerospermopsis aphanizomenoides LEGE 00250]